MAIEMIENHPYEEIRVGQTAELQRTLTRDDIVLFGKYSGTEIKIDGEDVLIMISPPPRPSHRSLQ